MSQMLRYLTMRCCFPSPHSLEHLDQPLITHSFFDAFLSFVVKYPSWGLATVKVTEALYSACSWFDEAMTTIGPNNGPLAIKTSSLELLVCPWWSTHCNNHFYIKHRNLRVSIIIDKLVLSHKHEFGLLSNVLKHFSIVVGSKISQPPLRLH